MLQDLYTELSFKIRRPCFITSPSPKSTTWQGGRTTLFRTLANSLKGFCKRLLPVII